MKIQEVNRLLGTKLREYLKEKGIKSSYLSAKIGIPKQSLNAVFKGKRKLSATEYFEVCNVLGVSADFFNSYSEIKEKTACSALQAENS